MQYSQIERKVALSAGTRFFRQQPPGTKDNASLNVTRRLDMMTGHLSQGQ